MSGEPQPVSDSLTTAGATSNPLVEADEAPSADIPGSIDSNTQVVPTGQANDTRHDGQHVLDSSEDPNQKIEDYDWTDTEHRYHDRMQLCADQEAAIFESFNQTIKLFENWTAAITAHESDRSYKRLKTRVSFVQGAEERLEKKRQHYSKVVSAFESALALLRST